MNKQLDLAMDNTGRVNNMPLIRASELAQYSFCQRAWWLSTVQRLPSSHQAALKHGTQIHHHHARQVWAAQRWRQAGFFLLAGGGLLLIIALAWLFLAFKVGLIQ